MADAAAPRQRLALTVILIAMGGLAVWFAGIGPYLGAVDENGEILWKDSVEMWWVYDLHPANSYANPTIASEGTVTIAEGT